MNSTIVVGQTSSHYEVADRAGATRRLFRMNCNQRLVLLELIGGFFSAGIVGSAP